MVKASPIIQRIDALIRPSIEDLGFDVVRIRLHAQRNNQVLQIMAEPSGDNREMTVQDCALVSRHISAILDVEDPISGTYNLEVSSPGIDRPLSTVDEFTRYIGHDVSVEMEWPVDGRKRYKGVLTAVEGDNVHLKLDEKNDAVLDISGMQQAKLALTDKLISEHLAKRKAQEKEQQD
ncbi:MAG: ribosome maturation factor RimP [Alphaproteobacteria bacterium]|nr:ribosome maturation factor RimP [Alphaproteobacteria bacterium]